VLAGSCSGATLRQVELFRTDRPALGVAPDDVMAGRTKPADLIAFAAAHREDTPLIYSTATPDEVSAAQARFGREKVSTALEGLFAETAATLVEGGVRRLVVAGGETSGAVVSALGIQAFAIGPEIDPGVPALRTVDGPPLALALKSGNFGGPDFFEKALRALGERG
jgi:uncharacterized protein YgbK (DUF1537 family)